MNALLNNMSNFPPSLGFNPPADFGAYQNFLTPRLSPMVSGYDSLSSALANVPMGNYGGYPNVMGLPNMFGGQTTQTDWKNHLDEGLISEEEYRSEMRRRLGIVSQEDIEKAQAASQDPTESLNGEELKKARTSNKGNYKVTAQHSDIASQLIDLAKESLNKAPEMMTEKDIQTVEKIFSELNKNPMLAEAFIKEANETTLSGKTTTLLGKYEQVLTKHLGRKAAKANIADIKENLQKNVEGRNSELWEEFDSKTKRDSNNVEYSAMDKAIHNPEKIAGFTILGTAGLLGSRYIAKKALTPAAFSTLNKTLLRTGKFGIAAAAIAAAAYGTYKLCTSETK